MHILNITNNPVPAPHARTGSLAPVPCRIGVANGARTTVLCTRATRVKTLLKSRVPTRLAGATVLGNY